MRKVYLSLEKKKKLLGNIAIMLFNTYFIEYVLRQTALMKNHHVYL